MPRSSWCVQRSGGSHSSLFRLLCWWSCSGHVFFLPQIFLIDTILENIKILFKNAGFLVDGLARNSAANGQHLFDRFLQEVCYIMRAQNLTRKLAFHLQQQIASIEDALRILKQMEYRGIAISSNKAKLFPCAFD